MNYSGYLYLVGYIVLYFVVVAGIWLWRLNRRQERPPVAEKLLRGPGESLRREIEKFDDRLLFHLVGSALVPLLVMISGLWIIERVPQGARPWALAGLFVVLAAVLFFSARWLITILSRRRNFYLGYFGERVVGETVEDLRAKGFYIFHDVPANEASPPFGIDHVVVGPAGVFAIETKTRRKRAGRPGFEEHKIIFDGQQLIYPWGEDFHGLNQARDHALWLENWVFQILGRRVPVQAILAFPGWWVEEHAVSNVRVANPKQISAIITRNAAVLTEEQITNLARHFETRCRDVEF
jgi:HAMP domain-containing protein